MREDCDLEEMFQAVLDDIDGYGAAYAAMPANADRLPWVHTIGFVESFSHPEVGVIGEPLVLAQDLLHDVVLEVASGLRMVPGKDLVVDGVVFHLHDLGPEVLQGEMFDRWRAYYKWLDDPPIPELAALGLTRCRNQPSGRPNRVEQRALARRRHLRAMKTAEGKTPGLWLEAGQGVAEGIRYLWAWRGF